jgi:hypothetical protein
MIFYMGFLNIIGMMMNIAKSGENMEAADSAGVAVNLNIKVMSASESKNMDEEQTAKSGPGSPVSDWEDEAEPTQTGWEDDEDDEEQQMAAVRKATLKAILAKEEAEKKQQANHSKQMKRKDKRAASKPTLEFGAFAWLGALTSGADAKIIDDKVYRGFPVAVKKRLMAMIVQSRDAVSFREEKTHIKISAIGYDGGGEGDETEGQIVKEQSKKLADKFALIWRTTTIEAKNWASSVRGEAPAAAAPVIAKVVEEVKAVAKHVSPKDAMVADIMAGVGRGRDSTAPCMEQPTERDAGFDVMAKAKEQAKLNPQAFRCTRPCEEFKTGVPCRHRAQGRKCNWGHCVDQMLPKKCAWPTECNKAYKKNGACECAHFMDGRLESPAEVMDRLFQCNTLVKLLPVTEVVGEKVKPIAVAAVNSSMSLVDKRAATRKHREQLDELTKRAQPVVQRRPVVHTGTKGVGPAPEKVWTKPVPAHKEVEHKVAADEQVKPVMRCTPEMAMQMLQLMKAGGMDVGAVVFEIV